MMRFLSSLMIVVLLTCSTVALSQDKTTDNKATTTAETTSAKSASTKMCGKCCCGKMKDTKAMKGSKCDAKQMKCDNASAKESGKETK